MVLLFACMPAARALSISYVAGWLFLPYVHFKVSGIPDVGKAHTIFIGAAIGLLCSREAVRLARTFRLSWIDAPALVICAGMVATSQMNGLGLWDGVSSSLQTVCVLAGPYLLGRLVFRTLSDVRELAIAMFVGGLVYAPLCLFEVRMSPQLHSLLYGFAPRGWATMRYGGYRPSVFLESGLELGLWMTASCIVGIALWRQGHLRKIGPLNVSLLVAVLLVTTLLCKSTGALLLLVGGAACCCVARTLRTGLPLLALLLTPIVYVGLRTSGMTDGSILVDVAALYVSEERASSLEFRLLNEDLLAAKALERPWFGWGGWGRYRVLDDAGNDITVTDGRWIITLGRYGFVGLVAEFGMFLAPCLAAVARYGRRLLTAPDAAPVGALVVVVALFLSDNLLNDFPNSVYALCAGAVGSAACMRGRHAAPAPLAAQVLCRHSWPQAMVKA